VVIPLQKAVGISKQNLSPTLNSWIFHWDRLPRCWMNYCGCAWLKLQGCLGITYATSLLGCQDPESGGDLGTILLSHRRKGICVYIWLIHFIVQWKLIQHCKATIPQLKNNNNGTSLVVQWIKICLPMQGTRVRSLVQEDSTCRGATKPMYHNYWSPRTLVPVSHDKKRSPWTIVKSSSCLPQLEKAYVQQWRFSTAKIKVN